MREKPINLNELELSICSEAIAQARDLGPPEKFDKLLRVCLAAKKGEWANTSEVPRSVSELALACERVTKRADTYSVVVIAYGDAGEVACSPKQDNLSFAELERWDLVNVFKYHSANCIKADKKLRSCRCTLGGDEKPFAYRKGPQ